MQPRDPQHLLKSVFGYDRFRGFQREVIDRVTGGGDALVLMPTGGGKSICYQLPALLRPGVGVVISPLIALMQDQVAALSELGVRAAFLNSTLDARTAARVEQQLRAGALDLVYVAPERLLGERTLRLLAECHEAGRLALFAIDEAHCVSQWGHDFRPEYGQLSLLRERFADVPRVALTATADAPTRREIVERLLVDAQVFVASFDRPNIRYRIVEKREPREQLLRFIRDEHPGEAGIVYCLARSTVEEVAAFLADHGIEALPYHAGMDAAKRAAHQSRFLRDDGLVMVATIAFGMGIDKPDVRFVAHLDMPKSIEGYFQETGRAGRDGAPAPVVRRAWVLRSPASGLLQDARHAVGCTPRRVGARLRATATSARAAGPVRCSRPRTCLAAARCIAALIARCDDHAVRNATGRRARCSARAAAPARGACRRQAGARERFDHAVGDEAAAVVAAVDHLRGVVRHGPCRVERLAVTAAAPVTCRQESTPDPRRTPPRGSATTFAWTCSTPPTPRSTTR
jgi:RecQ family ATP-dependent DNA helicase